MGPPGEAADRPAGGAYCDKGIIRFVSGDYAWGMPQALMIGYAASGYTMPRKLEEAFKDRKTVLKTKGALLQPDFAPIYLLPRHPDASYLSPLRSAPARPFPQPPGGLRQPFEKVTSGIQQ